MERRFFLVYYYDVYDIYRGRCFRSKHTLVYFPSFIFFSPLHAISANEAVEMEDAVISCSCYHLIYLLYVVLAIIWCTCYYLMYLLFDELVIWCTFYLMYLLIDVLVIWCTCYLMFLISDVLIIWGRPNLWISDVYKWE